LSARKASPVPLELIANPVCIYACQYKHNHYSVAGHGSQSDGISCGRPYNQFYLNWCFLQKLTTPGEFLRSPWLRPEDLGLWQEAGIRYFKLAGRGQSEDDIIALCRAYMDGSFSGNLLEIMGWPHWQAFAANQDGSRLPPLDIHLDNAKLDGFLPFFKEKRPDCRLGCARCGHCDRWAQKALSSNDPALYRHYIRNMQQSLSTLVNHIPTVEETTALKQRWAAAAGRQVLPE